jgi:hypothetical protein
MSSITLDRKYSSVGKRIRPFAQNGATAMDAMCPGSAAWS